MISSYLGIPVNFGTIIRKAELDRVDIKQSIRNMIHLIITTSCGEVKCDPLFGCEIWQYDFDTIYNSHALKEELKKSILSSIRNNEKRLSNLSIDLHIEQLEVMTRIRNKRIKTRVVLAVNGLIEVTDEPFTHQEVFFIGPLSYS